MVLEIASTWDGQPAHPHERTTVTLIPTPDALQITVEAPYHGDPPPEGPPGPCWALWEREVVEVFILGPDERYTEVELSPHGHHLLLRLEGRRQIVARLLPLAFQAHIKGERWSGVAELPWTLLPPGPWRGNAYAIHGTGPARRYLAATPAPGPEPDFHRLECFPPLPLTKP